MFSKAYCSSQVTSELGEAACVGAQVGVGCSSAKEVATAIQKAVRDAKKNLVKVNITKDLSFPHFYEHYEHSAKIMLRPAAEGTGACPPLLRGTAPPLCAIGCF